MKKPVPVESASALIDEKIKELGDWRGKTLAKVREIIHEADPEILEEKLIRDCPQYCSLREIYDRVSWASATVGTSGNAG